MCVHVPLGVSVQKDTKEWKIVYCILNTLVAKHTMPLSASEDGPGGLEIGVADKSELGWPVSSVRPTDV